MKILVQNYSTALSTEALYLHKSMTEAGCEAIFWADPNISTFDMFDSVQPDLFLTHFGHITDDILKYLSGSQIGIVLNVTGASQDMITNIEDTLSSRKIKSVLFFTNTHDIINPIKQQNTKLISILPALDIFVPLQNVPDYHLDACFVTSQNKEAIEPLIEKEETYHTICLGAKEKGFDFNLDISSFISLVNKRYKKCIIVDDIHVAFSQLFFEATFRSEATNIIVPTPQQDTLNKVLATLFHEQESDNITEAIKLQIKQKHNALNRTSRLLKHLGCEEESNKVRTLGESL